MISFGSNANTMWLDLPYLFIFSFFGFCSTMYLIPRCAQMFLDRKISGKDMGKRIQKEIPESGGVISGCVFLMITFLMIPVSFWHDYGANFPHSQFVQLLAALLSITCMLLLGFADDVLDLRWRHKLILPLFASLPLLMVYYVSYNRTDIVVPIILRPLLGENIDLSILYYIYMAMLAIFCTNAINILAGINGLEVGQSVIIALSIMLFNFGEMEGILGAYHRFSLFFLFPYVATSLPLLYYNWYPSQIFVGDTFCYFSGMTLAVVAILGHFSKTLLLFFIPQVLNFVYSVPQLFHMIPCPRHRLPKYNSDSDLREMSSVIFKLSELKLTGRFVLKLFTLLKIVKYQILTKDGQEYIEINNLTLINFILYVCGPLHEQTLTVVLLLFQIVCSGIAFGIRYPLALKFYGEIIA